jgi:hypothetical protein
VLSIAEVAEQFLPSANNVMINSYERLITDAEVVSRTPSSVLIKVPGYFDQYFLIKVEELS